MSYEELLDRVSVDPSICGGKPCARGTRIHIAIILVNLAEGLSPEQINRPVVSDRRPLYKLS